MQGAVDEPSGARGPPLRLKPPRGGSRKPGCSVRPRSSSIIEAGYVIPDFRLPEATLLEIRAAHGRLLARHPEFRDYCSCLLQYDTGFLNFAREPAILGMVEQVLGTQFRALELELLRQTRARRQAHALASGRRILADPAARDLHGVDRGRCRDLGKRLSPGHQRLAQGQKTAPAPDGRGDRRDPQPGTAARTSSTRPRRSTSSSRRARSRCTTFFCSTARRPTPPTNRAAA